MYAPPVLCQSTKRPRAAAVTPRPRSTGRGPVSDQQRTDWGGVAFGVALGCLAAYQQFKLPPVLPTLLALYGYDRTVAGAFMSVYAVAGLLLSLWLGGRIQRRGAGPYLQGAFALMLAGDIAVLAWPQSAALVLAARGLEGIAFAVCAIAGPAYALSRAAPAHLGIVIGLAATWIPVGQLAAALLAPAALATGGWRLLWGLAVLLTSATAVWTWSRQRRRLLAPVGAGPAARGTPAGGADRGAVALLLSAAVFMLWSGQYFGYMTWLPQYLVEAYGASEMSAIAGYSLPVAVLLVFNVATGLGLRAGIPLLPLLIAALASQAAVWWLIPLTQGPALGVVSLVAYGIGAGIAPTCLFGLPSAILGPGRAGAGAFGVIMTGRNLGVLLGPVLLAELSKRSEGWEAAMPVFAAGSTAALLLALPLARLVRRPAAGAP